MIIALVALVVTGVPFLAQMGIAAATAIAIAVALSLTLVPALLAFAGPRMLRGKTFSSDASERTMGARWVAIVMRRPLLATGVVVVALGALAIPAL